MNVKVSNVNQPQWKEVNVRAKLPANLDKLQELAYNLWWVWNSEGKNLFRQIDNEAWHRAQSNPIMLINTISYERMQELSNDKAFMEQLDKPTSVATWTHRATRRNPPSLISPWSTA